MKEIFVALALSCAINILLVLSLSFVTFPAPQARPLAVILDCPKVPFVQEEQYVGLPKGIPDSVYNKMYDTLPRGKWVID